MRVLRYSSADIPAVHVQMHHFNQFAFNHLGRDTMVDLVENDRASTSTNLAALRRAYAVLRMVCRFAPPGDPTGLRCR